MIYRAIGLMSGSSLDGLDIAFVELHEERGDWSFEIKAADCFSYNSEWKDRLQQATQLDARSYLLLHAAYGHYLGNEVNRFIEKHQLHYKVGLVASHGHTTFHDPAKKMTGQLGDGAAIAAVTRLPVVSDLRALDVAFGGQGAPIVPVGEKLLFKDFSMFLNLGGIANISFNLPGSYIAFDVCPANRVMNMLAALEGKEYDDEGRMAAAGVVHDELLSKLNELDYYKKPYPKSLSNMFGTEVVYPLISSFNLDPSDALRTYASHIAQQVKSAIIQQPRMESSSLLVTGGGALNQFLISLMQEELQSIPIKLVVPEENIIQYKEALVMALIGVLRWRQEYNVLSTVTGAERDSIGGAVWIGQEA